MDDREWKCRMEDRVCAAHENPVPCAACGDPHVIYMLRETTPEQDAAWEAKYPEYSAPGPSRVPCPQCGEPTEFAWPREVNCCLSCMKAWAPDGRFVPGRFRRSRGFIQWEGDDVHR